MGREVEDGADGLEAVGSAVAVERPSILACIVAGMPTLCEDMVVCFVEEDEITPGFRGICLA